MKSTIVATAFALAAAIATPALAAENHDHGARAGDGSAGPAKAGGDHDMMRQMMRMHGAMHGGGMHGGGMHGGGMDHEMMRMMMGGGMMGADSPEEMRAALKSRLEKYDANGDGALAIDEFEALHSALIREKMVDRFQHLDADGDGQVTAQEMNGPADRLEMRRKMHEARAKGHMGSESGGMKQGDHMGATKN